MGGAVSAGEDNDELIDNLVEAEYIKSPHVERIFRAVDRGDYYLEGCKENAYRDLAWKHGNIHLSAPCIYSEVMESLKLGPGMSFLNLGSGTGYLSTMAGLVLGAYGVNHGVELHEEVVEYARTKLEEFQSSSPAVDKYEFCPPSFVVGNCLLLDSSCHQYDRVYCGASCPSEHENYMKNLVRVGGILVMPLNDHLLQITRTGETTYEVKNVLPVSFASLVTPLPAEARTLIKLPEKNPLKLQEICRTTIRILLRINAETENPSLKDKKKLVPSRRKKSKRRIRKVVIPVFDDSNHFEGRLSDRNRRSTANERVTEEEQPELDDEEDDRESKEPDDEPEQLPKEIPPCSEHSELVVACGCSKFQSEDKDTANEDKKSSSLESSSKDPSLEDHEESASDNPSRRGNNAENCNLNDGKLIDIMVASPRTRLPREAIQYHFQNHNVVEIHVNSNQAEPMDTSDETESKTQILNSDALTEESCPQKKEDSQGNQNAGNGDSGIDNISDDSVPEESSSDPEKTEGEAGLPPNPSTSRSNLSEGAVKIARHINRLSTYLKRSADENDDEDYPPVFCEKLRIAYSDVDSDEFDDFESDSGKESFPQEYYGTREKSDLSCYTFHMKQKINSLPLPQFLKMYLNYSRPV